MPSGDYTDPNAPEPIQEPSSPRITRYHGVWPGTNVPADDPRHPFQPGWEGDPQDWNVRLYRDSMQWASSGERCPQCGEPQEATAPMVHFTKPAPPGGGTHYHAFACRNCGELPPAALRFHSGTMADNSYYTHERHPEGQPPEERWTPPRQPRRGGPRPAQGPAEGPYTGEPSHEEHEVQPYTGHETRESSGYLNPLRSA